MLTFNGIHDVISQKTAFFIAFKNGSLTHMGEKTYAYKILARKPEGNSIWKTWT
jgi:hypothetical protein